jgi:hypothetical protein
MMSKKVMQKAMEDMKKGSGKKADPAPAKKPARKK